MNRQTFADAVDRDDVASRECARSLRAGDPFQVGAQIVETDRLLDIYRRRATHVQRIGIAADGFDQAVTDIAECGYSSLRLAAVEGRESARHFQVFLAPHADEVVACLSVDQSWKDA